MTLTIAKPSITTKRLSILVTRTADSWVAECIEHQLATTATTREELDQQIAMMFTAHELAAREVGIEPYTTGLAPVEVRIAFDCAPRSSERWVFTPSGRRLHLTIREAGEA